MSAEEDQRSPEFGPLLRRVLKAALQGPEADATHCLRQRLAAFQAQEQRHRIATLRKALQGAGEAQKAAGWRQPRSLPAEQDVDGIWQTAAEAARHRLLTAQSDLDKRLSVLHGLAPNSPPRPRAVAAEGGPGAQEANPPCPLRTQDRFRRCAERTETLMATSAAEGLEPLRRIIKIKALYLSRRGLRRTGRVSAEEAVLAHRIKKTQTLLREIVKENAELHAAADEVPEQGPVGAAPGPPLRRHQQATVIRALRRENRLRKDLLRIRQSSHAIDADVKMCDRRTSLLDCLSEAKRRADEQRPDDGPFNVSSRFWDARPIIADDVLGRLGSLCDEPTAPPVVFAQASPSAQIEGPRTPKDRVRRANKRLERALCRLTHPTLSLFVAMWQTHRLIPRVSAFEGRQHTSLSTDALNEQIADTNRQIESISARLAAGQASLAEHDQMSTEELEERLAAIVEEALEARREITEVEAALKAEEREEARSLRVAESVKAQSKDLRHMRRVIRAVIFSEEATASRTIDNQKLTGVILRAALSSAESVLRVLAEPLPASFSSIDLFKAELGRLSTRRLALEEEETLVRSLNKEHDTETAAAERAPLSDLLSHLQPMSGAQAAEPPGSAAPSAACRPDSPHPEAEEKIRLLLQAYLKGQHPNLLPEAIPD